MDEFLVCRDTRLEINQEIHWERERQEFRGGRISETELLQHPHPNPGFPELFGKAVSFCICLFEHGGAADANFICYKWPGDPGKHPETA